MGTIKDITGQKFNRLLVVNYSHKSDNGKPCWNVRCDCGNELKVIGALLKNGNTKSCGCLRKEITSALNAKHNLSKNNVYVTWQNLIQRCTNIKSEHYKDYGGRGIKVCDRWFSFENFYYDMGVRPKGMSIDRIDVNGDYCKENCRWSTQKEQCNNKRSNLLIMYRGKIKTLMQWSEELGIKYSTLNSRINRSKWTIEKALSVI